ncbi:hypothetical protein OHS33_36895 [Streptomyces sp. NBC_00536]|uniref:hypothetical protein n=1 Tax=Streptomyces sp. NBC_00536 TaxID=2975769 RepID=UPI002E80191D|nr:hypothetical protein [Streptomyces sp. NBC_00536]WUC83449.1 hypothetical protein OHS33_36895 [Streptomyces sp. NBC_00536]
MNGRPPAGLSPADLADYHAAQADHDDLLRQVHDREAQYETGLLTSWTAYHFTWDRHETTPATQPAPCSRTSPAPTADASARTADARLPPGTDGADESPF